MDYRFTMRQLGLLMLVLSASMFFSAAWGFVGRPPDTWFLEHADVHAFGLSIATGFILGIALLGLGRHAGGNLGRREALLLVALSWFAGALLSALPFWFWAKLHSFEDGADSAFRSYVNCYFESMSGLTTTGSTVLTNIPSLPASLLMWRAFTHWIGGLGIVVLFVAVLPLLGVGGRRLFKIETTGPTSGAVTPRIHETARMLWFIYLALTVAQVLLLRFVGSGISWFDSLTHTFATLATGGFSTLNESIGGFDPIVHWITVVFMVFAGVNFGVYYQIMRGKAKQALADGELRTYLIILLVGTLLVMWNINGEVYATTGAEPQHVARDAAFQVVSIQTTTGFCTANFDQWPALSKAVLLALMFVGGCGGSTGGGIKVMRVLIAFKVLWNELEKSFRPNVVRPVRVSTTAIDHQHRLAIVAYVLGILLIFVLGTGLLMMVEDSPRLDGATAATAVIATLNNIGPGLAQVGAVENYGWFSDTAKLLMCVLMAIGRLEVFAVLVLFMPRYWMTQ